ncbi:MAG TPA: hypothetical protein VMB81_23535 [Candidatus Sulfotelmatobacter sp.]|nr:hypothetical protein [Candidatus Sulfotelmatobacter sp.]
MIAAPTSRRAAPIVAIAALLGVALFPWLRWATVTPAHAPAADAAATRALPVLPPLDQLRETTDRPLFAPDRRPAPGARATAAPLGLRLEGVIAIGAQRHAIIKRADGTTARVAEGDTVGAWTVRQITTDRVVLASGDRTIELAAGRAPPSAR